MRSPSFRYTPVRTPALPKGWDAGSRTPLSTGTRAAKACNSWPRLDGPKLPTFRCRGKTLLNADSLVTLAGSGTFGNYHTPFCTEDQPCACRSGKDSPCLHSQLIRGDFRETDHSTQLSMTWDWLITFHQGVYLGNGGTNPLTSTVTGRFPELRRHVPTGSLCRQLGCRCVF